ncbi:MAG: hypothetical protein CFE40_13715 [Burkholderiales bacterium PBB1]|nr:MAG: hypothetical protein CFE40_13715 [Burkholderiales bacterium PBB1]
MAEASIQSPHGAPRVEATCTGDLPAELAALGIELGRWVPAAKPVSSLPQLTYARELDALQCRVGATRTDRVHWRYGQTHADAARSWREPRDEHTHGEPEVRVVLQGHVDFRVRVPGGDEVAHLFCGAGTWIVLPADLPHTCRPASSSVVEMLRLFQHARDATHHADPAFHQPPLPARVGRSLPRHWRFAT